MHALHGSRFWETARHVRFTRNNVADGTGVPGSREQGSHPWQQYALCELFHVRQLRRNPITRIECETGTVATGRKTPAACGVPGGATRLQFDITRLIQPTRLSLTESEQASRLCREAPKLRRIVPVARCRIWIRWN